MTTYGSPAQPEDPYQRPPGTPGGPPPIDPTLPEWGQPPAAGQWGQQQPGGEPQWGQQQPGSEPQWGQPPSGGEAPAAPQWGQPDPMWNQPQPPTPEPAYPPPTSGAGYPPPSSGAGYPPPSSGAGYPSPSSGAGYPSPADQGGYPTAGPYPPAGPTPAPGNQWGAPPPNPGAYGMPPAAPPAKSGAGKVALIIGLVVVLLLCPCLALVGWGFYQAGEDDDPIATPTVSAPVNPSGQPTGRPTSKPTDEPSAAPTSAKPSPSRRDFAKGDCVVNDGTATDAELRKVPCGPNTYEVLLRIPGTADGDRCKTRAPEATANYVHDNSIDFLDYVLCLKKR